MKNIISGTENNYPFLEGDNYWTIEDDKIIWSCWDYISEELFDLNPNKLYFKSKKIAINYLKKSKSCLKKEEKKK